MSELRNTNIEAKKSVQEALLDLGERFPRMPVRPPPISWMPPKPPGSAPPRSCPALSAPAPPPGLNRFRRPKAEVPVKRKELRPCRMLASPLTASKRKAGLSESSVLRFRESETGFNLASTSPTDVSLRVGKEEAPTRRRRIKNSFEDTSFILGGWSRIAGCVWNLGWNILRKEEEVARSKYPNPHLIQTKCAQDVVENWIKLETLFYKFANLLLDLTPL